MCAKYPYVAISFAFAWAAATRTGFTVSVPMELAARSPFAKSTSIAETTAATLGERSSSCCNPDSAKTHTIRTPNAPTAAPPSHSTRRRSRFPRGKSGLPFFRFRTGLITPLFSHAFAIHKTRACARVLCAHKKFSTELSGTEARASSEARLLKLEDLERRLRPEEEEPCTAGKCEKENS